MAFLQCPELGWGLGLMSLHPLVIGRAKKGAPQQGTTTHTALRRQWKLWDNRFNMHQRKK